MGGGVEKHSALYPTSLRSVPLCFVNDDGGDLRPSVLQTLSTYSIKLNVSTTIKTRRHQKSVKWHTIKADVTKAPPPEESTTKVVSERKCQDIFSSLLPHKNATTRLVVCMSVCIQCGMCSREKTDFHKIAIFPFPLFSLKTLYADTGRSLSINSPLFVVVSEDLFLT